MNIAVGQKIGMTQVEDEGEFVGVSVIKLLPLVLTQIKKKKTDGYQAIQVGVIDEKRRSKLKKPQRASLKKMKANPVFFREFRIIDGELSSQEKVGKELALPPVKSGDRITVSGMTMGRGFQGVIKRYNARRGPETHGSDHHRAPGSIGQCAFPARVFKGKKMPGRMGVKKATIKNLKLVRFDEKERYLLLKGSVPGKKGGYLGLKVHGQNKEKRQ